MRIHETDINLFKVFNLHNLDIDWNNVSILDYGCNQGNLLKDFSPHVTLANYTGIDIVPEAINLAKINYPDAKFILYNKYHPIYNPTGDINSSITNYIDRKFDVIVARGVYSHFVYLDLVQDLGILKTLLNENGIILFTLPTIESFRNFYRSLNQIHGPVNRLNFKNIDMAEKMVYWVDNEIVIDQENFRIDTCTNMLSFYNTTWLLNQVSGLKIMVKKEIIKTSEEVFSYR